ncbi:MAG: RnfABCDGE type electron transport complex subunit G [Flavobacteriaceae bacterium]
MKKKESTLLNMVVVLFTITLVAGLSLGYVNDLTLEPKARAKLAKMENSLKLILPEFDNYPIDERIRLKSARAKDSIDIYPAFADSTFVGAAVTGASEKGYSGLVKLMVGFSPDGKIINIAVLEQKETPGLGTKMKRDKFLRQFRGKNPLNFDMKVEKDGGEVDALAGATISTRAFSEATQEAYDAYIKYRETMTKPEN